ncbi:MAG: hypothetical protein JWO41_482 [Candidatus Saccharibacteria bacterium]|nr:hypothetical protein [Candidatus Saccharibacteria bacterium]
MFKKLDPRGFAHHFAIALLVVGIITAFTFQMVAGHADTASASGATAHISCATNTTNITIVYNFTNSPNGATITRAGQPWHKFAGPSGKATIPGGSYKSGTAVKYVIQASSKIQSIVCTTKGSSTSVSAKVYPKPARVVMKNNAVWNTDDFFVGDIGSPMFTQTQYGALNKKQQNVVGSGTFQIVAPGNADLAGGRIYNANGTYTMIDLNKQVPANDPVKIACVWAQGQGITSDNLTQVQCNAKHASQVNFKFVDAEQCVAVFGKGFVYSGTAKLCVSLQLPACPAGSKVVVRKVPTLTNRYYACVK